MSRNHIDAYYRFVDRLTDTMFFNLNHHDVEIDFNDSQLRKGMNHLKAMLMRDPTERITSIPQFIQHKSIRVGSRSQSTYTTVPHSSTALELF